MGALTLLGVSACSGRESGSGESGTASPSAAPAAMTFDPASITPQLVALGDSIFHGKVAIGTCQSCHGEDATGPTGIAPNLTDDQWLHGDGSWEFIYNTIMSGVMAPKQFSSVMLPMGGSALTPDQVRAVSAYVYSLSHKTGS